MSIVKALKQRAEMLTVAELAKLLQVTTDTVQRWGRLRLIPTIRVGDTVRFDPGMLADWLEVRASTPNPIINTDPYPLAPGNPEKLRWEELGELVAEKFKNSRERTEPE